MFANLLSRFKILKMGTTEFFQKAHVEINSICSNSASGIWFSDVISMNPNLSRWRRLLSKSAHLLLPCNLLRFIFNGIRSSAASFVEKITRHAVFSTLSHHFTILAPSCLWSACPANAEHLKTALPLTSPARTWTHKVESLVSSGLSLKSSTTSSHSFSLFKGKAF